MQTELLASAANALRKAALNEEAKNYVLQNEQLYKTLKKAARRYIGGETLHEAAETICSLNGQGYYVTTDFMGESIRNEHDATTATQEFFSVSTSIEQ